MKFLLLLSYQQAKHFLRHVFDSPFDVNYYAGDWMMGPNYFCWQPICYVTYDVNSFAWQVKPRSYEDLQLVIDTIMKHKSTFDQYRSVVVFCGEKGGQGNSFFLLKSRFLPGTESESEL